MKKALLVGINNYAIPNSDLRGCVNDVENMKQMLISNFNFDSSLIKTLTNYQATTDEIKNSLRELVRGAKAGDTILFHYSGHGSQTTDLNAEEPDGVDEIICPHDLNWHKNMITDDFLYSVFKDVSSAVQLIVISDSCHSGSLLRNMIGEKNRAYNLPRYLTPPIHVMKKLSIATGQNNESRKADCLAKKQELEANLKELESGLSDIAKKTQEKKSAYEKLLAEYENKKAKQLAEEEKIKAKIKKEKEDKKSKTKTKMPTFKPLEKPSLSIDEEITKEKEIKSEIESIKSSIYANDDEMGKISSSGKKENFNKRNGILLSGCESKQTSADAFMDGKFQGAFTCTLTKILSENNFNITYGRLINLVNKKMDQLGYSQNPQLECPEIWKNKKFLG